jgi:predicted O-methyltransferase YrrM
MIRTSKTERYLATVRERSDPLLAEMEVYAAEHDVPIADAETAALVAMLARAAGGRAALEVGLAIGYTALHVARSLAPGGRVTSLERDAKMITVAREFLSRDPAGARIDIVEGDAAITMAALSGPFDLVYVDADKTGYPRYVELALERLRPGGLVLIDNLLMDGAVATGHGDGHWSQASVDAARELSAGLTMDPTVSFVLLPVGDGVGVLQQRQARGTTSGAGEPDATCATSLSPGNTPHERHDACLMHDLPWRRS